MYTLLWKKNKFCWTICIWLLAQHSTVIHNTQYTTHNTQHTIHNIQYTIHNTQYTTHNTQHTIHNTQYTTHNTQHTIHNTQYKTQNTWFIISFESFVDLVKVDFGEVVCLSWIGLGTGGSWTVCCQRQMMFVDSDRRWLLTATDDQFVDRCTIYWQLTVLCWNVDSHYDIRGQRPVDICYYGVGGRIPRTRCLVPSAAFYCWTCFLDSGSNWYLRQTLESICAFCLVHGQHVKPFETRIDAQSLLTFATFETRSMTSTLWAACQLGFGTDSTIPYQSLNFWIGARDWLERVIVLPLQAKGLGVTNRSTRSDIASVTSSHRRLSPPRRTLSLSLL